MRAKLPTLQSSRLCVGFLLHFTWVLCVKKKTKTLKATSIRVLGWTGKCEKSKEFHSVGPAPDMTEHTAARFSDYFGEGDHFEGDSGVFGYDSGMGYAIFYDYDEGMWYQDQVQFSF